MALKSRSLKIDAQILDAGDRALLRPQRTHRDVQVPAAAGIFGKGARSELVLGQSVAVPETDRCAHEMHLAGAVGERGGFEGDPAKRVTRALGVRHPPAQPCLLGSLSVLHELLVDRLHGLGVQLEALFGRAAGEGVQIERGEEPTLALQDLEAQRIDVVPDEIDRARLLEQEGGVLVAHPQVQDAR